MAPLFTERLFFHHAKPGSSHIYDARMLASKQTITERSNERSHAGVSVINTNMQTIHFRQRGFFVFVSFHLYVIS